MGRCHQIPACSPPSLGAKGAPLAFPLSRGQSRQSQIDFPVDELFHDGVLVTVGNRMTHRLALSEIQKWAGDLDLRSKARRAPSAVDSI